MRWTLPTSFNRYKPPTIFVRTLRWNLTLSHIKSDGLGQQAPWVIAHYDETFTSFHTKTMYLYNKLCEQQHTVTRPPHHSPLIRCIRSASPTPDRTPRRGPTPLHTKRDAPCQQASTATNLRHICYDTEMELCTTPHKTRRTLSKSPSGFVWSGAEFHLGVVTNVAEVCGGWGLLTGCVSFCVERCGTSSRCSVGCRACWPNTSN
jgi:hypothetical protein